MSNLWILDADGNPVREADAVAWARWLEEAWRNKRMHVGDEQVGDRRVSTVFLGIDHSHGISSGAVPILFETMIFGPDGVSDEYQERYATRAEAEKGHAQACKLTALRAKVLTREDAGDH